mgnify:CR=1 FL=1
MAQTLPDDPSLVTFLNVPALFDLARANVSTEELQANESYQIMSAFDAAGLGLRFRPDRVDGVLYLWARNASAARSNSAGPGAVLPPARALCPADYRG